jgi:3-hydroxyacyl-[acyl-carrier-protein] dehydratase
MPSVFREAILFNPDPAAYLPHRDPFLFLDRIISLESGVAASALLQGTADARPMSPILLIEAMAQLGGIAAGQREGAGGILAAFDRAELPQAVCPGEQVTVAVRIVKGFGKLFLVEGTATVNGSVVARANLTLAIGSLQ